MPTGRSTTVATPSTSSSRGAPGRSPGQAPRRGISHVPNYLCLLASLLLLNACAPLARTAYPAPAPSDPDAGRRTRALYANLIRLAPEAVLFGHQDDLAYGVDWRREPGRSDVRDVAGSYPAVYGWELGDLEHGSPRNLDRVRFDDMQQWIREGYRRGAVITIGWHMDNPVSGGDAWDTTPAVAALLPGGTHHEDFKARLDRFAEFVRGLKVGRWTWLGRGHEVPILFRPYHENTGDWFWWGAGACTPGEYVALWRFTVEYLRDVRGLHNLLYVYSTDRFDSPEAYWARYPGDAHVDVLGFDDYDRTRPGDEAGRQRRIEGLAGRMRWLVAQARARGKLPAFTETGYEAIPDSTWWTGSLLAAIKTDSLTRGLAYVLVWRNANRTDDRPGHFYAPHPGHPSAADFVRFRRDPLILFEDDLPPLYRRPR